MNIEAGVRRKPDFMLLREEPGKISWFTRTVRIAGRIERFDKGDLFRRDQSSSDCDDIQGYLLKGMLRDLLQD